MLERKNKANKPMTQTRIAKDLGLSQRTVSQAFCGTGRLSQETREKILEYARKVGYRPNFSAQSIRGGTQNRLGLFMGLEEYRGPLPPRRLQGMQLAAFEEGVSLALCTLPDRKIDKKQDLGRLLGGFGVDAMLVNYATDISAQMSEMLQHFHVPTITINSKLPYDCIHPDDEGIARSLGEDLVSSGNAPVLYVTYGDRPASDQPSGYMPVHYSEVDRENGLRSAINAGGGQMQVMPIASFSSAGIAWLGKHKGNTPPTIVCYNETIALRAYTEACAGGVFFPEDFNIKYFARQPFHDEMLDSVLKGIVIPEFDIGYRAVKMLLERLAAGEPLNSEAIGIEKIRR